MKIAGILLLLGFRLATASMETLSTDLPHLNTIFMQQYAQTVQMLTAEHRQTGAYIDAAANQTLQSVNAFTANVLAQLGAVEQLLDEGGFRTNASCAAPHDTQRQLILLEAIGTERRCAAANGRKLRQATRGSTFYQLTRLMFRESMGVKSQVHESMAKYNPVSQAPRLVRTISWMAEWLAEMWPSSAANVRVERERVVRGAMRAEVEMGLCELQVGIEFGRGMAGNVVEAMQC